MKAECNFCITSLETFQVDMYAIFQMILEHVTSREDHFGLFQDDNHLGATNLIRKC
jgi:hypothetical protein